MAVKWKWNNNTGGGNVPADLTQRIQAVETKASTNETNITNLNNSAVKTTGDQSIAGVKTFTGTGEVIKLNSGRDDSAYMSGYKSNNRRIWYFGKGSSSNDEFVIGSTSNIKLEAANIIHCNNKKLTNVADPANNTDAATKQYVDNRIKKRILSITNTQGNTYTIQPTAGYEIINVMAGRKRTAEGYYFFNYQSSLNFQLFMDSSGAYKLYTEGPVSGFNGDYKIIVVEMKV